MNQPYSFGEWLGRRRRALDWTQEELAKQAGCAVGTIRKLEADERRPSKQLAEILAQRLDIPPKDREDFVRFAREVSGDAVPALPLTQEIANLAPTRRDAKPTHNLPAQLTSFIGREREMAEVRRLLETTRLLTLTGAGGTGKTRLALQVAAERLGNFPDGIWFVELAPLADPSLVVQSVMTTLGLRERASTAPETILKDYLHAKNLLLLLDNCEHLLVACAQFADTFLRACPHLKILASSREPLGVTGETTYRVPSLSSPTPTSDLQLLVSSPTQYDAVRLFIDRAQMVLPSFQVTNQNTPSIAQICYRLDGIPLALELAAARIKGMKPGQIAERLDDRFRLLTGGSRAGLPRHQTLRATMDWSYGLLSESERRLLGRLSVFAGGWMLEAAEAVCTGDTIEANNVLDLLLHLIDKSLVVVDEEAKSQAARYRMLETIRQYAREKLLDSGESEHVRDRHLDFYLKFAEDAEPKLVGADQMTWFNRLDSEHDNLRNALDWSLSENRAEKGLRTAAALYRFWLTRGYWSEGYQRLVGSLRTQGADKRTLARGKALQVAGGFANMTGSSEDSHRLYDEGISILREIGEESKPLLEIALANYAFSLIYNDLATARTCAEEAAQLSRESGNTPVLALALVVLGNVARWTCDFTSALQFVEESAALCRETGDNRGLTAAIGNLTWIYIWQGDLEKAKEFAERCITITREMENKYHFTTGLLRLGIVTLALDQSDEAEALLHQAVFELTEMGHISNAGLARDSLGRLQLKRGNFLQAQQELRESLVLLKEGSALYIIPHSLESFAFLSSALKKAPRAARLFGATQTLREKFGTPLPPGYRTEYESYLASTRAQLDEATFNAAWSEGNAMTMEQAIEYALAE